jgi:hypothetical protein
MTAESERAKPGKAAPDTTESVASGRWTRPQVRRLATSSAESGPGPGFDGLEVPS